MRKKYRFLIILALFISVSVFIDYAIPVNKGELALFALKKTEPTDKKRLEEIYEVFFPMAKAPMGTVSMYLPKYRPNELNDAIYYFSLFGIDKQTHPIEPYITETEDFYTYTDSSQIISVNKLFNMLHFINKETFEHTKEIAEKEAIDAAVKFIESKFLYLNYEEAEVSSDGNIYEILFINRIGNVKNYAFASSALVDKFGNVTEFKYYNLHYERLVGSKIKSMEEAFAELPVDFPNNTKIMLNRCNIVYVFENSIVQPAYLFEGKLSEGKTFKSFVSAAIFSHE